MWHPLKFNRRGSRGRACTPATDQLSSLQVLSFLFQNTVCPRSSVVTQTPQGPEVILA